MSTTKKTLVALAVVLVAGALAACHPSSVPNATTPDLVAVANRCDSLLDQQEETIAQMGAALRCDPSYEADEQSHCPPTYRCSAVAQWNLFAGGVRQPDWWLWSKNLSDHWLCFYAWEGVGEIYAWRAGQVPSYYLVTIGDAVPASVEQQASSFAASQPCPS